MGYKIEEIEGIGPVYAEKLGGAGIKTTDDLLDKCASKEGRAATAKDTDISEKLVLRWANMADLMRISGVGEEYSDLLEAAGVDTVKELRNRNAENLTAKMAEVNAEKNLTRALPGQSQVEKWVEQAKELPPMLTY
jgi:predicted flap endonuclease-1-like 5' DNA nuclease